MKERPINFKAWEVQAIREGRKTQTRRVVKWPLTSRSDGSKRRLLIQPDAPLLAEILKENVRSHPHLQFCPYGAPGDRLWVRECHYMTLLLHDEKAGVVEYRADYHDELADGIAWRPSIYMPRWASRITLEIVSVRVERLNEITPNDCRAEGQSVGNNDIGVRYGFGQQWEADNGPGSWESNPWVWVVEFRRVRPFC